MNQLSEKKAKRGLLNLTTTLNPLEYLFLPSVYSRVISPGSTNPFEFSMLSDVEEDFQFDIKRKASSFDLIYNEKKKKIQLSFFKLLRRSGRMWLIEEITLFFFRFSAILTAFYTKAVLHTIEEVEFDPKKLWFNYWMLIGSVLGQTIFQTNMTTFNSLLEKKIDNVVKVINSQDPKNFKPLKFSFFASVKIELVP